MPNWKHRLWGNWSWKLPLSLTQYGLRLRLRLWSPSFKSLQRSNQCWLWLQALWVWDWINRMWWSRPWYWKKNQWVCWVDHQWYLKRCSQQVHLLQLKVMCWVKVSTTMIWSIIVIMINYLNTFNLIYSQKFHVYI